MQGNAGGNGRGNEEEEKGEATKEEEQGRRC